jgi:legumain
MGAGRPASAPTAGAAGLVTFPVGDYLYAPALAEALAIMRAKHLYRELIFFMEACESGSMFADSTPLGNDTRIYVSSLCAGAGRRRWPGT